MKSVTLEIPDKEYNSLGIKTPAIALDELLRKLKQKELKELFEKTQRNAAIAGLNKMTDEEINDIIKEVRLEMRNEKNNP
jgi:ribosomal protein L12E/L44/L45/RPP1/RPP2